MQIEIHNSKLPNQEKKMKLKPKMSVEESREKKREQKREDRKQVKLNFIKMIESCLKFFYLEYV